MTRRKKLLLNTATGFIKQIVVTICGFILPRYMLLYYGSSINGLVSSITHFLSFISLLEMGIGPVIQSNLYGPLAKKDTEQISKVIISSERFFRRIAAVFLIYIVILAYVFPNVINTDYDRWFSISLIVIIATSSFTQYFFGATYQLLLNADQKAYIQIMLQLFTTVWNTIFCVVLMKLGFGIHVVKLVTAVIYVLRPLGQSIYVHRHYRLDRKIELTEEPIKQKWNGFSQHLASVVCGNIDVIVLTLFSTLVNVSIYSTYHNVANGVTSAIMTAATGLESYFGNIISKNGEEELERVFARIEWIVHIGVTFIFTVAAVTIGPFIMVYTQGITDTDYIAPLFGVLLVLAYAVQCLRVPYFRVIKAAGHFKQTQNGAFISAGLNVIISIVLVFPFNLVGIAIGTLAAMLYHTCYFVWYLRNNILKRPIRYFCAYLLIDILIIAITFALTHCIIFTEISYAGWMFYASKVSLVTMGTMLSIYGMLWLAIWCRHRKDI